MAHNNESYKNVFNKIQIHSVLKMLCLSNN